MAPACTDDNESVITGGAAGGAFLILCVLVVVVLAVAVALRLGTHRWRWTAGWLGAWTALVAGLLTANYFNDDHRQQRHVSAIRDSIGRDLGLRFRGAEASAVTVAYDCSDSKDPGWVASGENRLPPPGGAGQRDALMQRAVDVLRRHSYTVAWVGSPTRPELRIVTGKAGQRTVEVDATDQQVMLLAADGCYDLTRG
jgi:hypothetical protein